MSNPAKPQSPPRATLMDPRSTGAPPRMRPRDILALRGTFRQRP